MSIVHIRESRCYHDVHITMQGTCKARQKGCRKQQDSATRTLLQAVSSNKLLTVATSYMLGVHLAWRAIGVHLPAAEMILGSWQDHDC
jgi:hypothetical protein